MGYWLLLPYIIPARAESQLAQYTNVDHNDLEAVSLP